MTHRVISLEGVGKRYVLGERHGSIRELIGAAGSAVGRRRDREPNELWALRDITLDVSEGEAVGIIGRNGAGKSTLLKVLTRITEPTTGVSRTLGRVGALLEVGTGFHPELTGRENVYLNGAILGMSRRQVQSRFAEIVEFAGVEAFIDTPVKRFSSGMYLRLAFGVAAHLDADIMVVDEVLAVGDAEFQRKCLAKMAEVERSGRTILFVSHNIEAIARLCPRVIWLERGRIVQDGETAEVIDAYLTASLEASTSTPIATEPGGPVTVEELAVVDAAGNRLSVLPRHEPFTIRVSLRLDRDIADLNVSVVVESLRGIRLLDEALLDSEPNITRRAGRHHLQVRVPPVLNSGEYTLSVWVGSSYETYVWAESASIFRLEGSTQGRSERALQLRLPWSVDSEVNGASDTKTPIA